MKFAYARTGGPLLNWSGPTPPSSSRAGETRTLGSLGDDDIPRPGAPEIISGYIPEGAARTYGSQMLGADAAPAPAPEKKTIDSGTIRKIAALASAFHGVRRHNGSVLWGLLWALGAFVAPVSGLSVVGIAVAQGFGHPKLKNNPARGSSPWAGVEIGGMIPYSRSKRRIVRRKRRRKARPRKRRQKTLRGMGAYALKMPRPRAMAHTRR